MVQENTFEVKESDTLYPGFHTFSFDLDEDDLKFSPYNQYLEFTLLSFNEDRHIFTENAPDNYYSDSDYLEEAKAALDQYDQEYIDAKNNQKIVLCLSILASFLLLYYTIRRDRKIRKRHQFYQPTTKIDYFREIPSDLDPVFAARLVFLNKKRKPKDGDGYLYKKYDVKDISVIKDAEKEQMDEEEKKHQKELEELEELEKIERQEKEQK